MILLKQFSGFGKYSFGGCMYCDDSVGDFWGVLQINLDPKGIWLKRYFYARMEGLSFFQKSIGHPC